MTSLSEQAAGASDGPDIVLAGDLGAEPRAQLTEYVLAEADDVTPEGQFPEYGRFFRVRRWNGGAYEEEPIWWEVPSGLAQLIEVEIEEAGGFENVVPERVTVDIDFAGKSDAGEWKFMGEVSVRDE